MSERILAKNAKSCFVEGLRSPAFTCAKTPSLMAFPPNTQQNPFVKNPATFLSFPTS